MTVLASHQPDFFPYMGYFYKMFRSDKFVFSDNVQYSKKGRHNYNDILTANGPHRLTMPISYHPINLNEVKIAADAAWVDKTIKTLWMEYKKAAYFHEVFPVIEELLMAAPDAQNLAEFNRMSIMRLAERFGLVAGRAFYISSKLDLKNRRDARIIEMCLLLGADTYYSGSGAKDYHIEEDYRANGVQLVYSDYEPLHYPQAGKAAAENMSVIDYVLNCGFELPGVEEMTKEDRNVEQHKMICGELNALYEKKNHDYGDSFHTSFMEEGMAMARIRLGDKYSRFKTLSRDSERKVVDESIRDTLIDLANYAIMTVMEMDRLEAAE